MTASHLGGSWARRGGRRRWTERRSARRGRRRLGFGRRRGAERHRRARRRSPPRVDGAPRRRTWAPLEGALAGAVRHDAVRFRRGVESRNDAWIDSSRRKQTTGGGFGDGPGRPHRKTQQKHPCDQQNKRTEPTMTASFDLCRLVRLLASAPPICSARHRRVRARASRVAGRGGGARGRGTARARCGGGRGVCSRRRTGPPRASRRNRAALESSRSRLVGRAARHGAARRRGPGRGARPSTAKARRPIPRRAVSPGWRRSSAWTRSRSSGSTSSRG